MAWLLAGNPVLSAMRRIRTSGNCSATTSGAAVARTVVDEHQLEPIGRPVERVQVLEAANDVRPTVEA